jgi:hypothetical protein
VIGVVEAADVLAIAGIISAVIIGWVYARGGAAKAWREVAESRAVKIEEQEQMIAELRERLSRLEALVERLRETDQAAVLQWGNEHERNAAARHRTLVGVLEQIRDKLGEGKAP